MFEYFAKYAARPGRRPLVVGASGGVGRAVLAVLDRTGAGRRLVRSFDEILLLDAAPAEVHARPARSRWLPAQRIASSEDLARVVAEHGADHVVDLSSLGTLDCVQRCDAAGVSYLTTSVEHWPQERPELWADLVGAVLPGRRPTLSRASHLVGSGMNPGVVNALVFRGLAAFSRIAGVPASAEALGLRQILVTEEDTTVEVTSPASSGTFPMTWSPAHCLEELFQPEAIVVREGSVEALGHPPHAAWYRARCGDRAIDGMVVPHEEVLTLAERFPQVEIAFIYRIPPAARRALAEHPGRRSVSAWPVRRMYPPHADGLRGRDRVGVLLCSERLGELWIGYDVDVAGALALGTTATQLQVAAGVLAGWAQLGRVPGIHFVEDLDWREHLAHVDAVLGPATVVHDRTARPIPLAARRRDVPAGRRPRAPELAAVEQGR